MLINPAGKTLPTVAELMTQLAKLPRDRFVFGVKDLLVETGEKEPVLESVGQDVLDKSGRWSANCIQSCPDNYHPNYVTLASRCHPSNYLAVSYVHNSGVLTLSCSKCNRQVLAIKVG